MLKKLINLHFHTRPSPRFTEERIRTFSEQVWRRKSLIDGRGQIDTGQTSWQNNNEGKTSFAQEHPQQQITHGAAQLAQLDLKLGKK